MWYVCLLITLAPALQMLGKDDFQAMGILLKNNQRDFKKHSTLKTLQTYLLIALAYIVVKFLKCYIYIGSGRCPGGGHGSPLQYSCLENPQGWRSLVGYSPWGHKELDMIEWLSTAHTHTHTHTHTRLDYIYIPSFFFLKKTIFFLCYFIYQKFLFLCHSLVHCMYPQCCSPPHFSYLLLSQLSDKTTHP